MGNNNLTFECVGLTNGGRFPIDYTGRGRDVSPEIRISNLSEQVKSLIVTLEDLDHPIKGFTHWVIWNIPATNVIPKGVEPGRKVKSLDDAVQGIGYGLHKYAGPKPPKGVTHNYKITVYAIDCFLDISSFSFKKRVLKAAEGHVLQQGEMIGTFE